MAFRVSVVIPVWDRVELTFDCLRSLAQHTSDVPFELIVVDNGSTDATPDLLASLSGDVQIITNPTNRGFGGACNQGAAAANGDYVLFLNNDTLLTPGWLPPLVACLDEDPSLGAVQPRLLFPDGRLNDAGGLVFAGGDAWNYGKGSSYPDAPRFACRRAPDYLSGACLLVRRRAFEEVGGFDPRYSPAYYEDTDLSFALRAAGWTLVYEPASTVIHLEGGTAGTDTAHGLKAYQVRNQVRFAEKWVDALEGRPVLDPAIVERWAHRPTSNTARSILMADPFPPMFDRASGSLRLLNLARCLREAGHSVAWYAGGEAPERARYQRVLGAIGIPLYGADLAEIPRHPDAVAGWASEYVPAVEAIIADRAIDLVIVGPWSLAQVVLPRLRDSYPDLDVVVDSCDLHFVREEREARLSGSLSELANAQSRRAQELAVYASADAVLAVSDNEAEVLRELVPGTPPVVIGNAHVPMDQGPEFSARHGLLFVANANHPPNLDGLRWWCDELAPRLARRLPGVGLTVVGNDPAGALASLARPGVKVLGWVPETLPFLHEARVSVAPLRFGAGVKGKVTEAMSAGLPVVTTTIGAEGLGIAGGEHALVADDPDSFVEAIVGLYSDEEQWQHIRAAAASHIESVAGMAVMRKGVDELIEAVSSPVASGTVTTISLVMNVRNEAGHLADAIGSCPGVDEVVIVDMESSDGTREIAESAGARVLSIPATGYCETARQKAIDAASGDWVLVLDADERLSPGSIDRLRQVAAAAPRRVSAYQLPGPVHVGGTRLHGTGWGTDVERHPRFFRRLDVTWPALIHAVPTFAGRVVELPDGSAVHLDHYCFADVAAAIEKFNRYSTVEAAERHADGTPTGSAVSALLDGIREFTERYEPEADGALSLTLSMGMLMYRFLTGMKLQELRGWPEAGLLPARSSMLRAWAAFESTLREQELALVELGQLKSPSATARASAS